MAEPADAHRWLRRFTPDEWLRAGMKELSTARAAFDRHAMRPALASARRAAGMGWNAVLALEPEPDAAFGQTYADHLRALAGGVPVRAADALEIPAEVRAAAKRLMTDPAAGPTAAVVQILTKTRDARLLEAAETVLAEAYTRVLRRRESTVEPA